MSQSPSEPEFAASDDGDLEEDGPLFPYQKLYYDAGDKAKIEAMNENWKGRDYSLSVKNKSSAMIKTISSSA